MKVFTLYEGSYSVDASKKFVPFNPDKDDPKDRKGSIFVNVQPFLVQLSNSLLLIDTGLGFSDDQGQMILHNNIRKAGFDPEDVDYVLMSHLHFDHAGGMIHRTADHMELSFPHATYLIQRGEWEGAFTNTSTSYKPEIFEFLQRNAQITLLDESGSFNENISFELTGAHTQFHQVFLITEGEEKVFFGGDVLPSPGELKRKFIAKYDYDGRRAMELREEFGKKAAAENWNCLFYHGKSQTTGYVHEDEDGKFTIS